MNIEFNKPFCQVTITNKHFLINFLKTVTWHKGGNCMTNYENGEMIWLSMRLQSKKYKLPTCTGSPKAFNNGYISTP